MKNVLYRASTRGHCDHGWLDTYHTFSFANYFDKDRMHFGELRVINDDIVRPGEGFGTHPHENMEIISIPLYGALAHKDSMGHARVIRSGEIQVMSAGTGITHSEYNHSDKDPVNFFQIWVFPDEDNLTPRYDQRAFDFSKKNKLVQIVSPDKEDDNLWIHQRAWFNMGTFDKGHAVEYDVKRKGNGVWAMVIEGEFSIGGQKLYRRDGSGLWDTDKMELTANTDNARILLIDVPVTGT